MLKEVAFLVGVSL